MLDTVTRTRNVLLVGGPKHGESLVLRDITSLVIPVLEDVVFRWDEAAPDCLVRHRTVEYHPSGWERRGVELWTIGGSEPWKG